MLSELHPRGTSIHQSSVVNGADYVFNEVSMWNGVIFRIEKPQSKISDDEGFTSLVNIQGDGTSLIHTREKQHFFVEYVPAKLR